MCGVTIAKLNDYNSVLIAVANLFHGTASPQFQIAEQTQPAPAANDAEIDKNLASALDFFTRKKASDLIEDGLDYLEANIEAFVLKI